ncbi:uncharacterized protein LOC123530935 [Mercenaria mercenaria]|uniref:uncharacterized protein LOC123530935 n=1 Tax=Mercenaria mercenaria TaxID=6596 RepID=UPI00234F4AE6|nr:uncharacterized protein LOC123530935 [Mercenaria mercenaria]
MSTTGTEKHCRLCLMLNKGGTKACHLLLLKRVEELTPSDHQPYPWTVHEFLQSKKKEMLKSHISKEKMQVLFPRTGITDLPKWDLSLFCTVLTTYCELKQLARLDVERLRTLRNELCHMNEPHIDDVKYKDYFETIQVIVTRILENNNDNETKESIEKVLNDIHEGPLSLVETLKEMHTFYSMEMDIREKLEYVKDVDERVLQKVEKFDELFQRFDSKLEQIDNKLDHETSSMLHSARNNFLLPGVEIFFDLKNLSQEEEERMSAVLEQLFEEVINEEDDFKSTIPADSYNKLREAVRKTFKLFLMKGWRITSARHECVKLHIRCLTFKSLAALFREHVQGHINEELRDLNFAISEIICGKDAQLETAIYKDEFWGVVERTISVVEDFLTDHGSDTKLVLKEKLQPYDDKKKHALSLTARNVTHEGPHAFECENELDACLRLLTTELGTEFNAPQVSVQATCKSKNTEAVTLQLNAKFRPSFPFCLNIDQESSTDENPTTTKETETEKNVPIETDFEIVQDSCLRPLENDSGMECYAPGFSGHANYRPKSYLPSAESMDNMQTIALLELYKSQRAIAHYLALAYLSFYDYQNIAGEVFTASVSARGKHLHTVERKWTDLVCGLCDLLEEILICESSSPDIVIEFTYRLQTLTEELQKSYLELQDTIRNLTSLCESFTRLCKHKEANTRDKNISRLENLTKEEQVKKCVHEFDEINLDRSRSEKETEMMYDDIPFDMTRMMSDKVASSNHSGRYNWISDEDLQAVITARDKYIETAESSSKHDKSKPETKIFTDMDLCRKSNQDENWRDENDISKMLRPGSALTGDFSLVGMVNLYEIFWSIRAGKEASYIIIQVLCS